MRTIKFRAWDTWRNKMISPNEGDFIGWHAPSNWRDIYKLMQFTGLHDKNGVEVYEGDILKSESNGNGEVVWDELKAKYNSISISGRMSLDYSWCKGSEVIGNIYEHPYLITK